MRPAPKHPPFHSARLLAPTDAGRESAEHFVRAVYRERYRAELEVHYPLLLAFRDADEQLRAVVGLRCAESGPLFVERYLGGPAEALLGGQLQRPVPRSELIEFGNFAARGAGEARALIQALIPLLQGTGRRWVLFVATRALRNAFARLGLQLTELGTADAAALGAEAASWGRYYQADPRLCLGDLRQVAPQAGTGREAAPRPVPHTLALAGCA